MKRLDLATSVRFSPPWTLHHGILPQFVKEAKGPKPPKAAPSYKPTVLGREGLDSRGHLPLDAFLVLCMVSDLTVHPRV